MIPLACRHPTFSPRLSLSQQKYQENIISEFDRQTDQSLELFLLWLAAMAISLRLNPLTTHFKTHQRFLLHKPINSIVSPITNHSKPRLFTVKSVHDSSQHLPVTQEKPRWESFLSNAASLYPVYVTVGGIVACVRPSTFSWFVKRGPTSYTLTLGFIMLVMGLTLELKDLVNLFLQRPLSVSLETDPLGICLS